MINMRLCLKKYVSKKFTPKPDILNDKVFITSNFNDIHNTFFDNNSSNATVLIQTTGKKFKYI